MTMQLFQSLKSITGCLVVDAVQKTSILIAFGKIQIFEIFAIDETEIICSAALMAVTARRRVSVVEFFRVRRTRFPSPARVDGSAANFRRANNASQLGVLDVRRTGEIPAFRFGEIQVRLPRRRSTIDASRRSAIDANKLRFLVRVMRRHYVALVLLAPSFRARRLAVERCDAASLSLAHGARHDVAVQRRWKIGITDEAVIVVVCCVE